MTTIQSEAKMSAELVLLAQDDSKMVLLTMTPQARRSDSREAVPMATLRLVIVQPSSSGGVAQALKASDAINLPVSEIVSGGGEGAVEGALQLPMARIDHPALHRREVAKAAREAAAYVRVRCAEAEEEAEDEEVEDDDEEEKKSKTPDFEFRLFVILDNSVSELQEEEEEEDEVGSDLEGDDAFWQRGAVDGEHWPEVGEDHDAVVLNETAAAGGQFAATHYEARKGEEAGEPSAATLLMRDDFKLSLDDPEFEDNHSLTASDVSRLVGLLNQGGAVEEDEAYKRAFDGNTSVKRVSLTQIALRTLRSIKLPPMSPIPPHMRTGY